MSNDMTASGRAAARAGATAHTAARTGGRIEGIQALRGIAATLVAAFHLYSVEGGKTYDGAFSMFSHGEFGVDLFFVISGFIIYYTAARRPDLTAGAFLAARFWRILPPYWAVLACYVLASVGLWAAFGDTSKLPDIPTLVVSALLLPIDNHIIAPAWSLSLELVFYIIFALGFFRFGTRGLIAAMLGWILICQGMQVWSDRSWYPALLFFPIFTEFLFGVAVAWLYLNDRVRYGGVALILGIVLFIAALGGALDAGLHLGREFAIGLPSALILYGLLAHPVRVPKLVLLWGESSYLMYLIHLLFFSITARVIEKATGAVIYTSTGAMVAIMLALTALSMVLTHYAEIPYQRWYKARMLGKRSSG